MSKALICLHFQNDICHPDGRVPFSLDRDGTAATGFLAASGALIDRARRAGWLVVHVHIAFAPDYSDLPRNCILFNAVEANGAVKRGSWGAAAMQGFEPEAADIVLIHACNNGFQGTGLDELLRERGVTDLCVIGLATQFSVEHTVRHAADLGYRVSVAADCCSSKDADAHAASLKTMSFLADILDSRSVGI